MKQRRKRNLRWQRPKAHTHSIKSIRVGKSHPIVVRVLDVKKALSWLSIMIAMLVVVVGTQNSSARVKAISLFFIHQQ